MCKGQLTVVLSWPLWKCTLPLKFVCMADESGIGGGVSLGQLTALLRSGEEPVSLSQYKCPAVIMSQHVLTLGKTPYSSRALEWLTLKG